MQRSRSVLAAFVLLLTVFLITHALEFPGSVGYLMDVTHGQKMLDMEASFSAEETYRRLEAFGELGRQTYRRTILTVDFVFPITAFVFFFLWARYASEKSGVRRSLAWMLVALPIAYVSFDFLENISILSMLSRFPERLEFVGAHIGYLTRLKRICMLGSLLVPMVLLLGSQRPSRLGVEPHRLRPFGGKKIKNLPGFF